jgi:DNA invertase Pin-like site-specific DNA recombinase
MTMRRMLGYIRVSTQEQVSGFGLEVQTQAIKDYCRANKLRLVHVYSDAGQSGSNGLDTRVELAEALALVEAHQVEGIVVYRLDRLARDLLLQETLMGRMRQAGAEVLSVSEPDIDSDDPTRVLVRQVLGSISQYERSVIRGRMMAGKAAKIARKGYGGGRPAFGFAAKDGELVHDAREQDVVALIRKLHADGQSLRSIAQRLDADGHRPKSSESWHPTQIKRILERSA